MNLEITTWDSEVDSEVKAARELDDLLSKPEYEFLTVIPVNRLAIEGAETAREALRIASAKIEEREQRTFIMKAAEEVTGVEQGEISHRGFARMFHELITNNKSIGEGGDADVYISKAEMKNGVSAICYKFAKQIGKNLGRNTLERELDLHIAFYKNLKLFDASVKVPAPYYYCEFGNHKMIAMERLPARSIDDLMRGFGSIPQWVDEAVINRFCDDLHSVLEHCHQQGLYHRDLHFGNLMFTQSSNPTAVLGYIIDFGVSSYGVEGLEPYKSTDSRGTFTYADDYGRVEEARSCLLRLKNRSV
jgi:serine/threonine protein kinase